VVAEEPSDRPTLFGEPVDRARLRKLAGTVDQVAGAELVTHGDGAARGVRTVRLRTGEIDLDVIVDRALDIGQASIRGIPVAWTSPTGIVHPGLADPSPWGPFRSFGGGLLTTCGLDHVGGPIELDASAFGYPARPTSAQPLHGRLSSTPARLLGYGIDWEADVPEVWVRGEVRQASVFGEVLVLERRIGAALGGRTISIRDRVRNEGYAATPHLILYHVNAGWPLLGAAARILTPSGSVTDGTGAPTPELPAAGSTPAEAVWEHTISPAAAGRASAAVVNPDIGDGRCAGLVVSYDVSSLPRLFQWRVAGDGHYVVGLEPTNLRLGGRTAMEAAGELPVLAPGEAVDHAVDLRLVCSPAELAAVTDRPH
jgi:hypothetical protein